MKKQILQKPVHQTQKKVGYLTYNKLVGEADGGKELSKEDFQDLLDKYHQSWENRLYVHFGRTDNGKDCIRVKPPCFCFCGHTFKSHEWWDSQSLRVKCRVPNCQCESYRYLHHQGSWFLLCKCKHTAIDHNPKGKPEKCSKCACFSFETSFSCQCGAGWSQHATLIENEQIRRELGKPVDTDVVRERLREKQVEGCGKCTGCKNRMPCANAKRGG